MRQILLLCFGVVITMNSIGQINVENPNFLIIMSDQHAPQFSGPYGHPQVKTPVLDRLAAQGAVFENAYTTSPICVPARMSFITGKLVHNLKIWDNGVPLPEDQPTIAHILRSNGYNVALSGKMHFRGHDRLHGFEEQLSVDMNGMNYPHPTDWTKQVEAPEKSRVTMGAGAGENAVIISDNHVTEKAINYLKSPDRKEKPWMLLVGLVSPHPPFKVPKKYFDMYPMKDIDMPIIPEGHLEKLHPANKRHRMHYGFKGNDLLPEEVIRKVRATYYGMVTFMDDKIGDMIIALEQTGQLDNTVVIYFSDHGESLGEHGMWSKTNLYEESVRIPMIISHPKDILQNNRIKHGVNTIDLTATIVSLAGVNTSKLPFTLDGRDLSPLLKKIDVPWTDEVFSEHYGSHSSAPMANLRKGKFKLHYYHNELPELYDLENDPYEFNNLANNTKYKSILNQMINDLLAKWDPRSIEQEVISSQQVRKYLAPYLFDYIDKERAKWPKKFTQNLNSKPK